MIWFPGVPSLSNRMGLGDREKGIEQITPQGTQHTVTLQDPHHPVPRREGGSCSRRKQEGGEGGEK